MHTLQINLILEKNRTSGICSARRAQPARDISLPRPLYQREKKRNGHESGLASRRNLEIRSHLLASLSEAFGCVNADVLAEILAFERLSLQNFAPNFRISVRRLHHSHTFH